MKIAIVTSKTNESLYAVKASTHSSVIRKMMKKFSNIKKEDFQNIYSIKFVEYIK